MDIRNLYIEMSNNASVYEKYCSTAEKNLGKIFSFFSTNYRGLLIEKNGKLNGFAQGFRVLQNVEGQNRADWARRVGTKQEVEKQHVVPMRKAELFQVVNNTYTKTSRGKVFEKLLSDDSLSYNDKLFLCYLLILPGYFSDIPNYIKNRTNEIFSYLEISGYTVEEILGIQKEFLFRAKNLNIVELMNEDYFYIDSFCQPFDGFDFVANFKQASAKEKQDLKNYVINKYKIKAYGSTQNGCILSYKYRPGGNYVKNTLIDTTWILYVTKKIFSTKLDNFDSFVTSAMTIFGEIFKINITNVKTFIYNTNTNRSVFQIIYCKLFDIAIPLMDVAKDLTQEEIEQIGVIDPTDEAGQQKLNSITQSLKKLAKIKSNYHCALEEAELCKYFTSKETHKNYLEIHHFIPREFSNDFDETIEVLDNYVALCPNCHRKIHFAEDNERKHLINLIYRHRQASLLADGLPIDIKTLYKYYRINS